MAKRQVYFDATDGVAFPTNDKFTANDLIKPGDTIDDVYVKLNKFMKKTISWIKTVQSSSSGISVPTKVSDLTQDVKYAGSATVGGSAKSLAYKHVKDVRIDGRDLNVDFSDDTTQVNMNLIPTHLSHLIQNVSYAASNTAGGSATSLSYRHIKDLSISSSTLTVTYSDNSTKTITLPSGSSGGGSYPTGEITGCNSNSYTYGYVTLPGTYVSGKTYVLPNGIDGGSLFGKSNYIVANYSGGGGVRTLNKGSNVNYSTGSYYLKVEGTYFYLSDAGGGS